YRICRLAFSEERTAVVKRTRPRQRSAFAQRNLDRHGHVFLTLDLEKHPVSISLRDRHDHDAEPPEVRWAMTEVHGAIEASIDGRTEGICAVGISSLRGHG